jgi:hypothetical protein
MELISLILEIIFAIFLVLTFWCMVYLFFKKLWQEHLRPYWESLLSGEKESFNEVSELLSQRAVQTRTYLHRTSYYFLSGLLVSLPGYFFSEVLSKEENGIAILFGLIGYPLLYLLLVFPLGIPLLSYISIGVTWLLHLPFFPKKIEESNQYIPISISGLKEMMPVEIWCDNGDGKMVIYGRLVEKKSLSLQSFRNKPSSLQTEPSQELLLQDDGDKFSIGEFQQNLEDGFFCHGDNRNDKLYIKRIN